MDIIRLKYGIKNFGVELDGYREGGNFKIIKWWQTEDASAGDVAMNKIIIGNYEKRDMKNLMYLASLVIHELKRSKLSGFIGVIYHHKGMIQCTENLYGVLKAFASSDMSIELLTDYYFLTNTFISVKE